MSVKLATKIYLLSGMALATGALASLYLMFSMNGFSGEFGQVLGNLQSQVRQADAARVMQVTFKKEVQAWQNILIRGGDPEQLKQFSDEFHTLARTVTEEGTALANAVRDDEVKALVEEFRTAHSTLLTQYDAAIDFYAQSKGSAQHEADLRMKGFNRAVTDIVDKIVAAQLRSIDFRAESQEGRLANTLRTAGIVLLLAYLGVGALSAVLARRISATLQETVAGLNETAKQVAAAASQISRSSQALAQGSSEQAASLEETSASSAEINAMARQNAENSRSAAALIDSSQAGFRGANQALGEMVKAMDDIHAQSDKISKIIKTIDAIAFQTNLLALNAAVEAARAGEAGMGFAVVADEVRNLAQRCTAAARDTAALIEESVSKSGEGKAKVDQTAAAVLAISGLSAKVKKLVDELSQASQEQAHGIDQIGTAISQMEQVTQRNAAGAEESAAAAQDLDAQSKNLERILEHLLAMVRGSRAPAAKDTPARPLVAQPAVAHHPVSALVRPAHEDTGGGKQEFPLDDDF